MSRIERVNLIAAPLHQNPKNITAKLALICIFDDEELEQ
jgi:hypothetical protein